MILSKRILIAALVVLLDLVLVIIPVSAFFLAYVIVFNPPWFRAFIEGAGGGASPR